MQVCEGSKVTHACRHSAILHSRRRRHLKVALCRVDTVTPYRETEAANHTSHGSVSVVKTTFKIYEKKSKI